MSLSTAVINRGTNLEGHRLVGGQDVAFDNSRKNIFRGLAAQIIRPLPQSSFAKCSLISLKAFTVIACFVSQYPSVVAASNISDLWHWKILFGAGELLAWGAVYSVCCLEIIGEISSDRDLGHVRTKTNICLNIAYWTTIIAVACLVQTSDIYISYKYTNESLFWPIYVGLVYVTFTSTSIHKTVKSATRTSNVFTRCVIRNREKIKTLNAKKAFQESIQGFIEYIQECPIDLKNEFIRLLGRSSRELDRVKLFLYMLLHGSNKRIEQIGSQSRSAFYVSVAFQALGLVMYSGNLYLDGLLVKSAAKLIVDNPYFTIFLVAFSCTPNVFLDLEMSCGTLRDIYWGIWNAIKSCRQGNTLRCNRDTVYRSIAYSLTAVFSVFGLGSTYTIANDTIGFNDHFLICGLILTFTALLTANSLKNLSDGVVDSALFLHDDEQTKKIKIICSKLEQLNRKISEMSNQEFEVLCEEMSEDSLLVTQLRDQLALELENGGSIQRALENLQFQPDGVSSADDEDL
ncbi:MAG: hypothetical protein JSS30_00855 [Verrucomicrobia bacterium]|nr:hypothetical protein [Verrucomicrobiota bacterium]